MKNIKQGLFETGHGRLVVLSLLACLLLSACNTTPAVTDVPEVPRPDAVDCANNEVDTDAGKAKLICIEFEKQGDHWCPTGTVVAYSTDETEIRVRQGIQKLAWQAVKKHGENDYEVWNADILYKLSFQPFVGKPLRVKRQKADGWVLSQPLAGCGDYDKPCIPGTEAEPVQYKYTIQKWKKDRDGKAVVDENCKPLDPVFRVML